MSQSSQRSHRVQGEDFSVSSHFKLPTKRMSTITRKSTMRRTASLSLPLSLLPSFAGAVLAGGKSSRMGRNKALLRVAGKPLWQRQRHVLTAAGTSPVWIVQAPGQRALTRSVLRDTVRDAGPLAGLHAALMQCRSSHLAVLAVDLPRLEADWFVRLAQLCAPGIGVVPRTREGYEPLAAIYPVEALAEVETRIGNGTFALQALVRALVRSRKMRVLRLKSTDLRQLANWNTPEDLQR